MVQLQKIYWQVLKCIVMDGDLYIVLLEDLDLKYLPQETFLMVCNKSFNGPLDPLRYSWANIALFGMDMED